MSSARAVLLRKRLQAAPHLARPHDAHKARSSLIPERADPSSARLSPQQLHSWRYAQAHPECLSDTLGVMFTFEGVVSERVLILAVTEIVARHEILRTTYYQDPATKEPQQSIHAHLPFTCEQADADPEEALSMAHALLQRPFDLTSDAPLRLGLYRTGPDQLVLTLVVHHILWDGAVFDLFCRELERLCTGVAVPELIRQYGDLAEVTPEPDRRRADTAYWRQKLAEPLPPLTLSCDSGDASAPLGLAGRVDQSLASGSDLHKLASAHRVTPFKAFLACWAKVLGEQGRGQQDEVLIGTTVLNRSYPESRSLIGNFANHLPLRLPVGENPDSGQLLPALSEEIDTAFEHAGLPYTQICSMLGCDDVTRPPRLFDSLVVFIPSGTEAPRLPDAACRWQRLDSGATQFPLVPLGLEVFAHGRGSEIRFQIEATFARRHLSPDAVRDLLQKLETTISKAAQKLW